MPGLPSRSDWKEHTLPPDAPSATVASGLYVEPFPATGARYQAPKQGRDFHPLWSPDGKALMYVPSVASRRLAITRLSTGPGVTFGDPELLRSTWLVATFPAGRGPSMCCPTVGSWG
jgi:hypothetical protein